MRTGRTHHGQLAAELDGLGNRKWIPDGRLRVLVGRLRRLGVRADGASRPPSAHGDRTGNTHTRCDMLASRSRKRKKAVEQKERDERTKQREEKEQPFLGPG